MTKVYCEHAHESPTESNRKCGYAAAGAAVHEVALGYAINSGEITMGKTIAGLALIALSACTSAAVGPDKEEALCGARPSHMQAQNAAKVYVDSAGLEDPSSAQVRDVRVEDCTSWHKGLFKGGGYYYGWGRGYYYGWQIAFELNTRYRIGGSYTGFRARRILLTPDGAIHWRQMP
jgi:hypothetical protein